MHLKGLVDEMMPNVCHLLYTTSLRHCPQQREGQVKQEWQISAAAGVCSTIPSHFAYAEIFQNRKIRKRARTPVSVCA